MSHRQLVLRLLTKAQCITVAYTWGNKYQTFPWLTLVKNYLMSAWSFWLNYFSLQYFPLYQCRQTSWWTALSLSPWRRLCFWMWAVIFPVFIGEVKHIFTFGGKCHCHQTFTLSAEFFRHGILQKYELEFWFFWLDPIFFCFSDLFLKYNNDSNISAFLFVRIVRRQNWSANSNFFLCMMVRLPADCSRSNKPMISHT